MRISIDAMGGDYAPQEIVAGTVEAARTIQGVEKLFLVGQEEVIRRELAKYPNVSPVIEVVHATDVVEMGDTPVAALRKKKDSSILRSVELVKKGDADAVFSAGNTGAAVAASMLKLRTLEGVWRPAIATVIPTPKNPVVLLDAGATPDSTSEMLYQFGIMGSVYSHEIMGVEKPRIGLLSIGEEDAKGNETTKEAFRLLSQSSLNFIGNVESRDIFSGKVDVVVCDGFVGNVVLKTSESVARALGQWAKGEIKSSPIAMLGALLCRGVVKNMKKRADPDQYGGAPLLGVNGVCIIGHGSSSHVAVTNAIKVACEWSRHDINHIITDYVQRAPEDAVE